MSISHDRIRSCVTVVVDDVPLKQTAAAYSIFIRHTSVYLYS